MDQSDFDELVEQTLEALELALDDAQVDYDNSAGILTVEFENDTRMIFSRQSASRQLWLATRSGGYHFEWHDAEQDWRCTRSGELLKPFTVREMQLQGGATLDWN